MTLEQLSREVGVLWSDKSAPCMAPTEDTERRRLLERLVPSREDDQCVVYPLGKETTTASFAMYTFSIAVLVQAIILISFSSFADHGKEPPPGRFRISSWFTDRQPPQGASSCVRIHWIRVLYAFYFSNSTNVPAWFPACCH